MADPVSSPPLAQSPRDQSLGSRIVDLAIIVAVVLMARWGLIDRQLLGGVVMAWVTGRVAVGASKKAGASSSGSGGGTGTSGEMPAVRPPPPESPGRYRGPGQGPSSWFEAFAASYTGRFVLGVLDELRGLAARPSRGLALAAVATMAAVVACGCAGSRMVATSPDVLCERYDTRSVIWGGIAQGAGAGAGAAGVTASGLGPAPDDQSARVALGVTSAALGALALAAVYFEREYSTRYAARCGGDRVEVIAVPPSSSSKGP